QAARREGRVLRRAGPAHAVDAAVLAVAPEPAGAAGVGAPVADVQGPVRAEHHLAGAEQRVAALEELELVRHLEGGAARLDPVGADELAEDVGGGGQAGGGLGGGAAV